MTLITPKNTNKKGFGRKVTSDNHDQVLEEEKAVPSKKAEEKDTHVSPSKEEARLEKNGKKPVFKKSPAYDAPADAPAPKALDTKKENRENTADKSFKAKEAIDKLLGRSQSEAGPESESDVDIMSLVKNFHQAEPKESEEVYRTNFNPDERLNGYIEKVSKQIKDIVDTHWLSTAGRDEAREELDNAVRMIAGHKEYPVSPKDLDYISQAIFNEFFGLGPLEKLFENDDIADIMVNGPEEVFIEINGRIRKTDIKFRSTDSLVNLCRQIVNRVGRRIDQSSPLCDARLADGSRVNVIFPPLAIDGAMLTIRKFKKNPLTLERLIDNGTLNPACAAFLQIIASSRVNVMVSGGTGSGKTTLLNCMTKYISRSERIVTCEDAAELQLQQPHVVRLETRPENIENSGAVTMRELVKNCLRMRPDRILIGEVRGAEAFELLQAMNTGHDGSMGTLHANNPREALSRFENMISMANLNIPPRAVREQIAAALDVIVHTQRLKDGSRKITHITEVIGMEGEVILTQDLMRFVPEGDDGNGKITGRFEFTGLQPKFFDQAQYYGLDEMLQAVTMSQLQDTMH